MPEQISLHNPAILQFVPAGDIKTKVRAGLQGPAVTLVLYLVFFLSPMIYNLFMVAKGYRIHASSGPKADGRVQCLDKLSLKVLMQF